MNSISKLTFGDLYGIQRQSHDIQGINRQNQNKDESIFSVSNNQDYEKDTQQLMEDRAYFNELYKRLQNGDMDAYNELNSIQLGEFVDGKDKNAKLYNENTKLLQEMKQKKPENNFFMK